MTLVRCDEVHAGLGFMLVELGHVGQAYGQEFVVGIAGALTQLLYGALGQQGGGQGVHTAADAQHQGL
ncbi:hypothetical protein D3C78_1785940 [compost metagenome]